jgi:hypothetical protein
MPRRGISGETPSKTGMSQEPSVVEQAIVRALRDNLERIQRTADELHHAVSDVVSACASNKPANALPPLLRAQTSAASLAATLEVLSRFVAMSMQSGPRSQMEAQITDLVGKVAPEPPPAQQRPMPSQPVPKAAQATPPPPAPVVKKPVATELELHPEPLELIEPVPAAVASEAEFGDEFDVNRLSAEEQELHRRANRVAKVSMQDIKMLRPEQVRLGRQNKDLCIRLKDDIEKAHREYDRRFKPIMDHPVDYFYRWMVEILAEGDAHALGEYPYATPARHH